MAATTVQPTEKKQMTKAKLNEEEIGMIEEALILYGAQQNRSGHVEAAKAVSEMIKKMQTVQALSSERSIFMEPVK